MADLKKEQFIIKGKDTVRMESISRPSLSFWSDAWRRLRKNKSAFIGLCIVVLYALLAIFAPMFSQYTQSQMDVDNRNAMMSAAHWLGTDSTGRDLWTRIWMGARVSLSIGLISAILNMCVGAVIGGLCGFYGGKLDMIMMRIVDLLYGIPSLIITILVMMVLGKGVTPLIVAMCVVGWIGTCRFVRGEVYRIKETGFRHGGESARSTGFYGLLSNILFPNILGMLVTTCVWQSRERSSRKHYLSYIGLGITPPDCSWGVICKEGNSVSALYPHQILVPAFLSVRQCWR